MAVMSGLVDHQFSIVYTPGHMAVVIVIPPIDCIIHVEFQKVMQWKNVCVL